MKRSLDKGKVSFSFPEAPAAPGYSFYEYHWDGPKRQHVAVWQPRQTTIFVVFDGGSRHLFSTARIVLYLGNGSSKDTPSGNVWDIQQLGSVTHTPRGQVLNPPRNVPTLPKLTVAFEVVVSEGAAKSPVGTLALQSPECFRERRRSSITVLLEREVALTCDTMSLSLSFTHSTLLFTPIMSSDFEQHFVPIHPASRIGLIMTRIVRVLPPVPVRLKITNGGLPAELLIKTFKDAELCHTWHDDLLSFAQVCRAWTCAMDIFHSYLTFSEGDKRTYSRPLLDVHALTKAVGSTPLLGHSFRQLTTDSFSRPGDWEDDHIFLLQRQHHPYRLPPSESSSDLFTAALITILGTTKHVQCVHLAQLDPSQSDALFTVLHELGELHTFSLGPAAAEGSRQLLSPHPFFRTRRPRAHSEPPHTRLLSVVQLARCLARWPSLTSLKIHHVHPGLDVLGLWRFALRPPTCTQLTTLTLSHSHLADRDLLHLFGSGNSSSKLERVTLDQVTGLTNTGLAAFLRAIAHTVVSLTVQDVALPPPEQWGSLVIAGGRGCTERALDGVVHTMVRLRELRIGGDVASEFMLDRRSKAFVAACSEGSKAEQLSVVQLWSKGVPRLCAFVADEKWPGWWTSGKH